MKREIQLFATRVAEMLGERHPATHYQLELIVRTLGPETVKALLKETLLIENNGGLMLPDGSRRRTIGGVFFHLVKSRYEQRLPREVKMYHTFLKLPKKQPGRPFRKPAPRSFAKKAS